MHEIQKNISKDKIIKQNKEIFTEDFARTFEKKIETRDLTKIYFTEIMEQRYIFYHVQH